MQAPYESEAPRAAKHHSEQSWVYILHSFFAQCVYWAKSWNANTGIGCEERVPLNSLDDYFPTNEDKN